jgi:uncharacterized protein with HEPN domain
MDAISMRLLSLAELIKRFETHQPGLFLKYDIDPQPIIRFRDFIAHHYDDSDYEIIFDVCVQHLPILKKSLQKMINS